MDISQIGPELEALKGRVEELENKIAAMQAGTPLPLPPADQPDQSSPALAQLQKECDSLREQLRNADTTNAGLEAQVKGLEQRMAELETNRQVWVDAYNKLKSEAENGSQNTRELESCREELARKDEELRRVLEEKDSELAQYREKQACKDEELRRVLEEKDSELAQYREEQACKGEELRRALVEKDSELERLHEQCACKDADLATLRNQLEVQQKELADHQAASTNQGAILARLWPPCLEIPELAPFRDTWRAELAKDNPDATLLCMFAYLFSWSSYQGLIEQKGTADNEAESTTARALSNFSRFFFAWMYENNIDGEEAYDISDKLAECINQKLDKSVAKYAIDRNGVQLGDKFAPAKMIPGFYRGEKSDTGYVKLILAWGIKNPGSGIYYTKTSVLLEK